MGDGKLQRVLRGNPFWKFRYGEEHCKVALLLSAILTVPLRDVIAMGLSLFLPLSVARGIGYVLLGACVVPLFIVPFLQCLKWTRDMFLVGAFILSGLLLFGLRRPEEVNGVYLSLIAKSMLMAFPYYIVARSLKDYSLLERALYSASYAINVLVFLSMWHRVELNGGYSMGAAYAALPGAVIAFRMLLRQFSFLAVLNAGISFFALGFCGTRGPIVCYVLFCIYEMTFNRGKAENRAIQKIMAVCMILGALLAGACMMKGLPAPMESRRLVRKIEQGTFWVEPTRARLRQAALEVLQESPLAGVGLIEDRLQIYYRGGFALEKPTEGYVGYYSHFVFLDWMLEYGFFVGTLISLAALCAVYKIFFMSQGSDKSCLEIFFFSGCVPLLFSGIWHEERLFYIVLGMLVSVMECHGKFLMNYNNHYRIGDSENERSVTQKNC